MGTKRDDAREAWGCMLRMLVGGENQRRMAEIASAEGLTVRLLHALLDLDPLNARPMRDLAAEWYCDASNVTGIVDGLEGHGLAERIPSKVDRRVKLIQLTPKGRNVRERVTDQAHEPPDGLMELSADELATMRKLLARAAARYQWPQDRPVDTGANPSLHDVKRNGG